jgi:phosphatidylinositol-4,5-bisphosphate 3-kinase
MIKCSHYGDDLNQITFSFVWILFRAEMDVQEISLKFGLMLETYLRGSVNHIPELRKQMDAIGKMRSISELLHSRPFKDKDKREKAKEAMQQLLAQYGYQQVINNCVSTLNPKLKLGNVKEKECRFYDSKMRPLQMAYCNPDPSVSPSDIRVIFKNGDDLRQDMLTLQIIGIMDSIWQQEGVDLRLLPYKCISTGARVGFIECVTQAETIANIQKMLKSTKSKLVLWDSSLLYVWLKDKSPTEAHLKSAAEAFCVSCAGYCVATYVLGIGDRHSDNIMVKENGQLFHIDFGHFLGNFKVKFGVRRERVPFVLASDFEHIIDKHFGFNHFANLCEDAYLILRRRAPLLINLLAMMLQTGIPELRSMDDLNYVREALVLGESDAVAKEHFRGKLQEARRNAWSTSLNWYVHGLSKDNRQ